MPDVPFVCSNCDLRYGHGFIRVEGEGSTAALSNNRLQCPDCGTMNGMAVPDGTYRVSGNHFVLIRQLVTEVNAALSPEERSRLRSLLSEAKSSGSTPAIPADLASKLPTLRRMTTDPAWLAVWVAVIMGVLTLMQGDRPLSQEDVERIVSETVEQVQNHTSPPSPATHVPSPRASAAPTSSPERNAPCPCGSQTKYKRCCRPLAGR